MKTPKVRSLKTMASSALLVAMLFYGGGGSTGRVHAQSAEFQGKELRLTYAEYRPLYYIDDAGAPAGMLVDFWNLWSERVGIPITFITVTLSESVEQVVQGKSHINPGMYYTAGRDAYLDFSDAYLQRPSHIYYLSNETPKLERLADLAGKRVACVEGDYYVEFIAKNQPRAEIVLYESFKEQLAAILSGAADACLMEVPTAQVYMRELRAENRIRASEEPVCRNAYLAAVREGDVQLLDLVNTGLRAITTEEKERIFSSWMREGKASEEIVQIEEVTIAVEHDNYPFQFVDSENSPQGILIDLWKLWGRETGVAVNFAVGTRVETVEMVIMGRADIHGGLLFTDERDVFLDFATELHPLETRAFFNTAESGIDVLDDLESIRIGVVRGDSVIGHLGLVLPEAVLVMYPSALDLFKDARNGDLSAFVLDTSVGHYFLREFGLADRFHVLGDALLYRGEYRAAVREGDAEMLNLINRGMNSIDPEARALILERWLGPNALTTTP